MINVVIQAGVVSGILIHASLVVFVCHCTMYMYMYLLLLLYPVKLVSVLIQLLRL
jgi:hypothetical protein